jgi:hypothetical protein
MAAMTIADMMVSRMMPNNESTALLRYNTLVEFCHISFHPFVGYRVALESDCFVPSGKTAGAATLGEGFPLGKLPHVALRRARHTN